MKEKIKTFLNAIGITHDTVERTVKTFVQAFLAYIVTAMAAGDFINAQLSQKALTGVLISAIAAGFSAVMNMIKNANSPAE